MADDGIPVCDFFISRAGENAAIAIEIARILRDAGYTTFIQDKDFGNTNFMTKMADAFALVDRGARVIAVLSPHYMQKEYTLAEAHYPLTGDPSNRKERLIVLRVSDCAPTGFLKAIPYVDLVPLLLNAEGFARAVRRAVAPRGQAEVAATPGAQVLHPDIRPVPGFTGREAELAAVEAALWTKGGTAALTNVAASAAVKGLGGVGKSVLAQEYAWRNRGRYQGVWWIRAEKSETLLDDLIELGARFIPGIREVPDRAQAAHAALDYITQMRAGKPWLLIYDNVEQPGDIAKLTPAEGAHVLITTRWPEWYGHAEELSVDVFSPSLAAEFLLAHARKPDADPAARLAADLGFLPLALAHARALCWSEGWDFDRYRAKLPELIRKAPRGAAYPAPVFATFDLAIEKAAVQCPAAERLMGICAFLAPDRIPLDIVTADVMIEIERGAAVAALQEVSLVTLERLEDGSAGISVHRLVQSVMQGRLGEAVRDAAALATRLVADAYPRGDIGPDDVRSWPACRRLESHAIAVLRVAPDDGDAGEKTSHLLNQYAMHLKARADFTAAEPLYRRALAIDEASFGPSHPRVAIDLSNLAALLKTTNRLGEAEPLMRRAIEILEKSSSANHSNVATALGNFAELLNAINRHGEAEPLMRRALAINEANFGPEHTNVAIQLNNLAVLLHDTNRRREAEPLMRRAISIFEKSRGADHPDLATSLNNLARLLRHTDRLGEAERLYRRALAIDEASLGPKHPNVAIDLNNLAGLLKATNRLGEAGPLYRRALAIDEASFGPNHPDVAIDLNNLAQLLQDADCLGEAEPLMRRALAIFEASLGPDHPSTQTVRENLAVLEAELRANAADAVPAPDARLRPDRGEAPRPRRGWARWFGGG